jgi:glycosyltransferase involved in cell wall biosynthesis
MILSVIVPCFNNGSAIQDLMRGISDQMSADCELILINDGSTDDTARCIKEFSNSFSGGCSIKYRETKNNGAAKARHLGLSLAKGEFVYFCDSDDFFHADFIYYFKKYYCSYPSMDMMFFSSEQAILRDEKLLRVSAKIEYDKVHTFEHGAELLSFNLRHGMFTAAVWTYIFRRELIARSEASFTQRSAHEDHLFTLSLALNASLVVAIPDLLYSQKIRPGSLTNSKKSSSYVIDRIEAFNEANAYLKKKNYINRKAYVRWSFLSIFDILNCNRGLIFEVFFSQIGFSYFLSNGRNFVSRFLKI